VGPEDPIKKEDYDFFDEDAEEDQEFLWEIIHGEFTKEYKKGMLGKYLLMTAIDAWKMGYRAAKNE